MALVIRMEQRTGEMRGMDETGDWKHEWDPDDKKEVDQMRKTFDHNVKDKNFKAFILDEKGKRGEQIFTFDPKAKRIVLVPPMAGG